MLELVLTGNRKDAKVTEVRPLSSFPSEYVHVTVHERSRMVFSRRWNKPGTLEFGPLARIGVETPRVVVAVFLVFAAKPICAYTVVNGTQ